MPIVVETPEVGLSTGSPEGTLPGTGLSVPLGIEAVMEYNGLIFNETKNVDKIRVMKIDGLADADIRDTREVNPSDHGETAFRSYYGGRTLTMTGRVETHSIEKLRDLQQAIRTAFMDLQEHPLKFRGANFLNDVQINVKKNAPLSWGEEQTDFRFFREFLLNLRASNPRFTSYLEQMQQDTGSSPLYVTVTNIGNWPALPVIAIKGPIINPIVTNINTGAAYKLNTTLGASDYRFLDANFATVKDEDGVSVFDEVDISSNWLDLPEGDSLIQLTGTGTTGATALTVRHRHTWL